jgi:hypothetical protein
MARNTGRARVARLVALAAPVALILSGCSDESGGTAIPTSTVSTNDGTKPTVSSQRVFGNLSACDILDKALEGQGFKPAVVDKAGGENGCDTNKPQFGSVGLSLQPGLGIDDLNADPSKIHEGEINDRPAMQIRNPIRSEGDCGVAIEVKQDSRALLAIALSTGTTNEACAFATEVAKKVEPQLPKGN